MFRLSKLFFLTLKSEIYWNSRSLRIRACLISYFYQDGHLLQSFSAFKHKILLQCPDGPFFRRYVHYYLYVALNLININPIYGVRAL